jgi:hypothetical protein
MGGAYSNMSCTIVIEERRHKSKSLSYMAEFKCKVVRCAEEKGNCKVAAVFADDENNVRPWWKLKAVISEYEVS